jgi:hypothetical protein
LTGPKKNNFIAAAKVESVVCASRVAIANSVALYVHVLFEYIASLSNKLNFNKLK